MCDLPHSSSGGRYSAGEPVPPPLVAPPPIPCTRKTPLVMNINHRGKFYTWGRLEIYHFLSFLWLHKNNKGPPLCIFSSSFKTPECRDNQKQVWHFNVHYELCYWTLYKHQTSAHHRLIEKLVFNPISKMNMSNFIEHKHLVQVTQLSKWQREGSNPGMLGYIWFKIKPGDRTGALPWENCKDLLSPSL